MDENKTKAMLKARGIDVPADTKFVNLVQQAPEVITGGWTDTQIRGKSEKEIISMINGCEYLIDTLRQNVRNEEDRLYDLRAIHRRKQQLGD